MAQSAVPSEQQVVARLDQRRSFKCNVIQQQHPLKSHPSDLESSLVLDTNAICRICWGGPYSEDTGEESSFISPCHCRGTQQYVHKSCIRRWIVMQMERKGPSAAYRCDICKSRFSLPPDMNLKTPPFAFLRDNLRISWDRLQSSPMGPPLSAFLTTSWIYAGVYGVYGVISHAAQVPRLLVAARSDPFTTLRPLLGRLAMAVVLEPLVSTQDFLFHLETVLFYSAGWLLDYAARLVDSNLVSSLPPHVASIAHSLLFIPKAIGLAFQLLDLAVMSIFGGGASGFVKGALICMSMPFRVLSLAARWGSGLFGVFAAGLNQSARGAAVAASVLNQGRGRV